MIEISILESCDVVKGDDYCRPLVVLKTDMGGIYTKSIYGGCPINNMKWAPVYAIYGQCWDGKTVIEMNPEQDVEFCRGKLPASHILCKRDDVNWLDKWESI